MSDLTKEQKIALIRGELFKHDWTYHWADDHKYWRAGNAHKTQIIGMAKEARLTPEEFTSIVKEMQQDPEIVRLWTGVNYG